jgi:hypothetical protein
MSYILTYLQGFAEDIFRALMNAVSAVFCYLVEKMIDLLIWFMDLFPDLPYADTITPSIMQLITVMSRANLVFPVVEFGVMFAAVVTFILIFIVIKLILKLIPTIG